MSVVLRGTVLTKNGKTNNGNQMQTIINNFKIENSAERANEKDDAH